MVKSATPRGGGAVTDALTIAVVEDFGPMRDSVVRSVRALGENCLAFANASDFLSAGASSRIDALVVDMALPDMRGVELQRLLRADRPDVPVVLISGASAPQEIIDAMKLGALDFLLKPFSQNDLGRIIRAIRQARSGKILATGGVPSPDDAVLAPLTPRERDVLSLLLKGCTNKEVAQALGISPGTAKIHRHRVLEKMEAKTLSELMMKINSLS